MTSPVIAERTPRRTWLTSGISPTAAAAAAIAILALGWRGSDLPAQIFRADLVKRYGFVLWNMQWYGGHPTLDYSVITPVLGALMGPMVLCALSGLAVGDPLRPHRALPLRVRVVDRLAVVRVRHRHQPDGGPRHVRARHHVRPRDGARDPAPPPRRSRCSERSSRLLRARSQGCSSRSSRPPGRSAADHAGSPASPSRSPRAFRSASSRCCSPTPVRSRTTAGDSSATCRSVRSSSSR